MSPFSRLSPIPSLPSYTGSYSVGTQDVEIPISDLSLPTFPLDPKLSSISFRLFYPCEPVQKKRTKLVYWLPEPQVEYWRAYARFMQASPWLASLLSYVPFFRLIHYTVIPAIRDAVPLRPPPKNDRKWPVMIFSHGLGGSKNAYSYICGSLASHGLVVVAPDHRDGSAPISFINESATGPRKVVEYKHIAHESTPEVEAGRDLQLKIRCWELGLVHDALLQINSGHNIRNFLAKDCTDNHLAAFHSLLDIVTPGKIAWSGHSFGAATMVQFVKSIFYGDSSLYNVPPSSQLSSQITPSSPIALLDLWTLPLQSRSTASLWSKPLPAYSSPAHTTTQPPSRPLAILSEAFYKWSSNLLKTLRAISPSSDTASSNRKIKPYIFYPISSAHLSQSDFGVLFPWVTRKVMKAEEPERTMRLNVRAILESLRISGITVADTSKLDMEIHGDEEGAKVAELGSEDGLALGQDHKILARDGSVRGWIAIDPERRQWEQTMNGHAEEAGKQNGHAINGHAANGHVKEVKGPDEAVMKGEVMKS
ncbi:MAG: hypothetical protein Q9217_003058 [Psora testacea]